MNILVFFLLITTAMGASLFIEKFLWPKLRKRVGKARIIKNDYVDVLFEKKADYTSAVQRKNTDLPIDKVFIYNKKHIELFKTLLRTLMEKNNE